MTEHTREGGTCVDCGRGGTTLMNGLCVDCVIEAHMPFEDCWECGGLGEHADCWEEYACVDPESGCMECLRPCRTCRGRGVLPMDDDSPTTGEPTHDDR